MKIQGYDDYKLASPPEGDWEDRELDLKIKIELHKDDIDNFIAWANDSLNNCDVREVEGDSEDEGFYCYSVYGGWDYEYNSDIDTELEIDALQRTLMDNYKCNFVEVSEN